MAFQDNGTDDWVTIPSAPSAPSSSGLRAATADPADDWIMVAPPAAPIAVRPTAPMPPVQAMDDWTPVHAAPNGEQNEVAGTDTIRSAGAVPKQQDERSFLRGIADSATSGFHSLRQQGDALLLGANARPLNNLTAIEQRLASGEDPASIPDADDLLGARWMTPAQREQIKTDLRSNVQSSARDIAARQGDIDQIPVNPVVEKATHAKSFGEFWQHFKEAPLTFIANVGAQSLPQMAPGLAASVVAGPLGGLPATAAAMGAGSYGVDYLSNVLDALREEGVDLKNPAAVEAAFSNPALVDRIGQKAHAHAAAVGAFDAASMGVAGKSMLPARFRPSNIVAEKIAELPIQAPIQGAVGAAGEATGQLLAGDEFKPGEIASEFFGEFAGAPAEVATATMSNGPRAAPYQPQPPQEATYPQAKALNTAQTILSAPPTPPGAVVQQATPPVQQTPPAAQPTAPIVQLSPIEQRLLAAAGLTPEQIATMDRVQIDAAIERVGEAAGAAPTTAPSPPVSADAPVASTVPLDGTAPSSGVSHETTPAPATAPLDAAPAPTPNRLDLQRMLDDPRPVEEIKAEMERAKNFAPTSDWQSVPPGVTVDPSWEVRQLDGEVKQVRLQPEAGTRAAPVELLTPDDVHLGAEQTAIPTPAQAEAGNFRKRRLTWEGLDISIETEQGAERTAKDGSWSVVMPHPYGEILGTKGADGDPLDITIGPNPQAPTVFVVDQIDPDSGKFDEHKSFQGFNSESEAKAAYEASFSDGSGYLRSGAVTEMPVSQFKRWATNGKTKKALAYTEPAPVAVQQRGPRNRGPMSLLEFIASKGGLAPHPEIRAIFDGNPLIPGRGRLIRTHGGMSLDQARAAAVEQAYLRDTPYEGGLSTSTIRDLLDAMDLEHRGGQKLYSEHDLADVQAREDERAAKQEAARRKEIVTDLRATVKKLDLNLEDRHIDHAADLVVEREYDIEEALVDVAERVAMADLDDVVASEQGADHGDAAAGTGTDGAGAAPQGEQPGGPDRQAASERAPVREQPDEAERAPAPAEAAESADGVAKPAEADKTEQNIPEVFRPKAEPEVDLKVNKPAEPASTPVEKIDTPPASNKPEKNSPDLAVGRAPRPAPKAPDPLDLAMSGELTAERARQIAADLTRQEKAVEAEIFGARADEWRRLNKQSDRAWDNADDAKAKALDARIAEIEKEVGLTEADEAWLNGQGWDAHAVPDHWSDISRNLQDIENGREDAVAVAASEVRHLPKTNDWSKMYSGEREAVITILSAMNAEKAAGRDPKAFLEDVFEERIERYGGGHDAHEVAQYQMEELANLLRSPIQREGPPSKANARRNESELPKSAARAKADDISETFSIAGEGSPRRHGIPSAAREPIAPFRNDQPLKQHPDYKAAKAGDRQAAARLVEDLVRPDQIENARKRFGADVTYVPVIAREQSGDNAIPPLLATLYSSATGAQVTSQIEQISRAFHTGANAMERVANRAIFDGPVERGHRYVLVDDVSVMGSTLADLADHIQRNGGEVAGVVLLANASRTGVLTPPAAHIRDVERRFGNVLREQFGIEPASLTADEAAYLRNFKDADALGARRAAATLERGDRLRSKVLRSEEVEGPAPGPEQLKGETENTQHGASTGAVSDSAPRDDERQSLAAGKVKKSEFTKNFIDRSDKITEVLREELDRLGLHDVALKVEESMRRTINGQTYDIDGYYLMGVVGIALDARSKFNTLHHEALHALYRNSLFTEGEWSILTRQSKKWREQFNVNTNYANMSEAVKDEEGVAHAYAAWAEGKSNVTNDGRIIRLFKRIQAFLKALGNALRGNGFNTVESIFESIDTGRIGTRTRDGTDITNIERFSVDKGPDGKDQTVIPGAERMSDREIARRKALAAKKAGKPQKGTEGLPLFGDAHNQGELFSVKKPQRYGVYMGSNPKAPWELWSESEPNVKDKKISEHESSEKAHAARRALKESGGEAFAIRTPAEKAVLDRIVPSEDKKGWWRRQSFASVYTAIKDDLDPIRRLRNELADGATVPAKQDPYVLARLTRGAYGKAQQFLENGAFDFNTLRSTGKSLKAILKPVKNDLDGLRAYAVSKRTLELDDRGIRTGVPVPEAQATVAAGAAKYQAAFEDLVAYQRSLTEYLHASGILSDEGYAAMLAANRDYVPFFRLMGEETELGRGIGSGLKTRNPVKGIRGSERQIIDPIESIIRNTFLFISLAERNRAVSAIDELAQASPRGDELVTKAKPGVHPVHVSEQEIRKFLTNQGVDPAAAGAMTIFRQNPFRPAPNEIAFFKNGKREIRTVDADVAEAINALDRESVSLITRILAAPARTLRAGAVLSPDFIARNPVRDQFSAFAFSSNNYIPVYDMVRGMASLFTRGEGYQAWLKSGGASASQVSIDRDYINQNVIKLERPGALSRIKNVVTSPIEALRIMSELTENATRIGEYMRAEAGGKDPFEAGFDAREVTLDFARFGAQARAVNAIIPFWNASVEGNDRAVRAFAKRPLATTFKVAASITLPSILLWWANHDDDRWKELPQWQRDIFWIVLTDKWEPYKVKGENGGLRNATDEDVGNKSKRTYFRKVDGKWQVNNGTVWKIPKPFELGILFGSVPERVLDAYFTDRPNAFKKLHKTVLGAFLPNMIPQAALPILEHATNHSFFLERQIVPKYLQDVRPKYQSTAFTTETAKKVGNLISKFNDETSFSSPIVLENYVRQWTGSIGMDTVRLIDEGLKAAGMTPVKVQPAKTINDMPVVRAFVARFPGASQSVEEFYDEYQKRKVNSATVKYLGKTGEAEAAGEEAASHPLQMAEKIHKALGVQSKVIRGIYLDKTMTPEEKRTLINGTYLQMIELSRAGNEVLRASAK